MVADDQQEALSYFETGECEVTQRKLTGGDATCNGIVRNEQKKPAKENNGTATSVGKTNNCEGPKKKYANGNNNKNEKDFETVRYSHLGRDSNKSETARRKKLPEKEFVERRSLMTEMLEVKEYQGLYNIFVVITINLSVYILLSDLFETGTIDLGMRNLMSQFGKPFSVLKLLVGMHLCSVVILYPAFKLWARKRPSKNPMKLFWDLAFGMGCAIFLSIFFYIPIKVNWADPLPTASAAIVVIEQLRLIMKMYSFVRVNVPRALNFNINNDNGIITTATSQRTDKNQSLRGLHDACTHYSGDEDSSKLHLRNRKTQLEASSQNDCSNGTPLNDNSSNGHGERVKRICPEFSTYVYFLYAPTLIYRDSYPRTKTIRWNFILRNIGETLGCIFIYSLIHKICGFVLFTNFGMPGHQLTLKQLFSLIFTQMIPGGVGYVVGFFILLHTSQNIFAELLRFGDRMFYKDWWNSDSFSEYYRLWNIPVHDFLYTYIYKESKELGLGSKFKAAPTLLVFIVSSLFHEYILIYVLRFFYPVLLILFGGFGVVFAFVPNRSSRILGNIFIWWSLITGKGLILTFYMLEYYARANNCSPAESAAMDFILPRTWTCDAIVFE